MHCFSFQNISHRKANADVIPAVKQEFSLDVESIEREFDDGPASGPRVIEVKVPVVEEIPKRM